MACQRRTHSLPRREALRRRPPKGLLTRDRGARTRGREEARAALSVVLTAALRRVGLPCASALPGTAVDSGGRSDGPRRRCAASLSSLFFSPRFQLSSAPATPPRALAPAGGRLRSEPLAGPPRRRGRAASRVSQNSPRSPGALGRGVQSPRRRQRRPRGARRSRLDKPNSNLVPERGLTTKNKEYNS